MNDVPIDESIKPYLDEIAERLWSGHAAVMVGAGFSKNANPAFPNWAQLGDVFYEKLHGEAPPDNKRYLNPLKLADEVQAISGRSALEELIRLHIPDEDYEPSPLHLSLLELPWVDVFTTNYD
ncbi:SIR2 family protein, partial [Candidatus Bipolaricaulota bacterium]|nr:SIR2 family protein [Candidatus Bipolaricaulota bacterium]